MDTPSKIHQCEKTQVGFESFFYSVPDDLISTLLLFKFWMYYYIINYYNYIHQAASCIHYLLGGSSRFMCRLHEGSMEVPWRFDADSYM